MGRCPPRRYALTAVSDDTFSLEGRPYIALHNLLKVEGWASSGAEAKHVIDAGEVRVDGAVELRRRCKLQAGQRVEMHGMAITIAP